LYFFKVAYFYEQLPLNHARFRVLPFHPHPYPPPSMERGIRELQGSRDGK